MESRKRSLLVTAVTIIVCSAGGFGWAQQKPAIDYQRDVRPILSNHCFPCHGADEESRAADLRLDVREEAIRLKAIVPGKPGESLMLHRITTDNDEEKMPPAETGKPLTADQISLLQGWIEQNAEYQDHWAFRRLERPPVPAAYSDPWCRNEIDAFILQRLRAAELAPSAEADRATLIRRLYQDLLGLLPSPAETDEYLQDTSPQAWESLVDRVLKNPHYGERWGRHWLDQARYADSNGYTIDGPRVMWPYRDWVIGALNRDLPFDQFTIEQLAGDLLPNATLDQKVASAFHRNTMINEEGGVKPDQFRHEALIDRVNTTGAVWMGLTVGCAQCHSHKYDPISHEEYYRLYAFFNAAADANNQSETVEVREQELLGWTDLQKQQLMELQGLRKVKQELEKSSRDVSRLPGLEWHWMSAPVSAINASGSSILKIQPDGSLLAKTHPAANDMLTVKLQLPATATGPVKVTAVRLKALTDPALPDMGPGTASNGNFVLTEILLRSGPTDYPFAFAWSDHSQEKYPVEDAIDGDNSTGWAINVNNEQQARGVRMNANHEAIFVPAKPVAVEDGILTVLLRHDLNKNYLLGHFAIEVSTASVAQPMPASESPNRLAEVTNRITELEGLLPGKGNPVKQMVMKDQAKPQETFLLARGDFLSPDRKRGVLQPGVPAVLDPMAGSKSFSSRLDLAQWLVSPDNPLTARVTVNRIWGKYFGRALAETENDFGFQGVTPTHPELLDWLAADFQQSGWSLKHLHRTIVTSAAYRQSSAVTNTRGVQVDPENYLLSRQSRFRVEAEIVRDLALVSSGLFSERIGGPGVHLPQPDGIYDFTQNKKSWPTATGPDRYRRTMYVMFYRSAPYPLMTTFDSPDFSTVCTRRVRSNTPLQSLTVANDQVFTELAEGLAKRILKDDTLTSDEQRSGVMFRTCLTRVPADAEQAILLDFFSRELSRFHSSPDEARKFVTHPLPDQPVELQAAWTSVARALWNTDEFLTRN
jgi:hypothetical protein